MNNSQRKPIVYFSWSVFLEYTFFMPEKLPDKRGPKYPTYATFRLPGYTVEHMRVINAYKDGLVDEIRSSIIDIVERRWMELQNEQRGEKPPAA